MSHIIRKDLVQKGVDIQSVILNESFYEKIHWIGTALLFCIFPTLLLQLVFPKILPENLIIVTILVLFVVFFIGLHLLKSHVYNLIDTIISSNKKIEAIDKNPETINTILNGVESIHSTMVRLHYWSTLAHIVLFHRRSLHGDTNGNIVKYFLSIEMTHLSELLLNIKVDLDTKIEENQELLKKAKLSLSTHINGTQEPNRASVLQQARLDKQIEQFEELQSVLVKM